MHLYQAYVTSGGDPGFKFMSIPSQKNYPRVMMRLNYTQMTIYGRKGMVYTFTAVAPTGLCSVRVPSTNIKHGYESVSCGFLANWYLLPKDVSFSNLYFRKGDALITSNGIFGYLDGISEPSIGWVGIDAPNNANEGSRVEPPWECYMHGSIPYFPPPNPAVIGTASIAQHFFYNDGSLGKRVENLLHLHSM